MHACVITLSDILSGFSWSEYSYLSQIRITLFMLNVTLCHRVDLEIALVHFFLRSIPYPH